MRKEGEREKERKEREMKIVGYKTLRRLMEEELM